MKRLKLILAAFILTLGLSTAAFAGKPKDDPNNKAEAKAETKAAAVSETKTQTLLYWFDAHTGIYIGHETSAGCDESTMDLCAKGYANVSDPLHPQEPTTPPTATEDGVRP